jgi:hypothetical protein
VSHSINKVDILRRRARATIASIYARDRLASCPLHSLLAVIATLALHTVCLAFLPAWLSILAFYLSSIAWLLLIYISLTESLISNNATIISCP